MLFYFILLSLKIMYTSNKNKELQKLLLENNYYYQNHIY